MHQDQWRRAEQIFHTALGLAPERRSRYLDQSCNADHELRRLVETLLFHDERAASFLERPVVDAMGSASTRAGALGSRPWRPGLSSGASVAA